MSLILKGINLPKKGKTIRLEIEDDGTVWEVGYDVMGRLQDAQAIQIPKGHGAIKDINTFLKDKCLTEYIENDVFNKKYTYTISTVAIYNAPTILESEEENERK